MPTELLPGKLPQRADADPDDGSESKRVRPPRAGIRVESPTRRAHRNRIKTLLKAARTVPQTA